MPAFKKPPRGRPPAPDSDRRVKASFSIPASLLDRLREQRRAGYGGSITAEVLPAIERAVDKAERGELEMMTRHDGIPRD